MNDFFIVYDLTTGAIKRHGKCPIEDLEYQARPDKNEGVDLDQPRTQDEARDLMIEQKVIIPANGAPYLRKRSASDIALSQPKALAPVPTIADLVAALKANHGIDLTPDL